MNIFRKKIVVAELQESVYNKICEKFVDDCRWSGRIKDESAVDWDEIWAIQDCEQRFNAIKSHLTADGLEEWQCYKDMLDKIIKM